MFARFLRNIRSRLFAIFQKITLKSHYSSRAYARGILCTKEKGRRMEVENGKAARRGMDRAKQYPLPVSDGVAKRNLLPPDSFCQKMKAPPDIGHMTMT
jgi:hypothetical protein